MSTTLSSPPTNSGLELEQALQEEHQTSFVVLPKHCNYMTPLIFGGHFMAELDLAAATLVSRILKKYSNQVNNAVTYKSEFTFHAPSYLGDIVTMHCTAKEIAGKHIVVEIKAFREPRQELKQYHVATAKFVFVTRQDEQYRKHGIG